ncbi:MAG: hypothetical protein M3P06_11915 [Acidobacteriota bacterium]|nr:hypothetical protein [Acidobacteriota bacterium]
MIRDMEYDTAPRYQLPRRASTGGTLIEAVARAYDVPLGYLLAGFSDAEVQASIFGPRVLSGDITLQNELGERRQAFADFVRSLPYSEKELLAQPLHNYRNEHAFAIIFRLERIYCGLEMLIVNEPPLLFWDREDIDQWVANMALDDADAGSFKLEFASYQEHFRQLAASSKAYRVVLNVTSLQRFLDRKSALCRREILDMMTSFLDYPLFHLVLIEPGTSMANDGIMDELEIICKTSTIPASLENTISVVIKQTPVDHHPVEYFVAPASTTRYMLQRDRTRIDNALAVALDQYEKRFSPTGELTEALQKRYTRDLLARLKRGALI